MNHWKYEISKQTQLQWKRGFFNEIWIDASIFVAVYVKKTPYCKKQTGNPGEKKKRTECENVIWQAEYK